MTSPTIRTVHPAEAALRQDVALSIIDSSVANYATCGALLAYPACPTSQSIYSQERLNASLALVLSRYPHFAGKLHDTVYDPVVGRSDHTRRFGRVWVLFGGQPEENPGVRLIFATSDKSLSDTLTTQPVAAGAYDARSIGREPFVPAGSLIKLRAENPDLEATNMIVKVTYYVCGGVTIGVGLHHCLSDTITLELFMQDWAAVHRHLLAGNGEDDWRKVISVRPLEPSNLDACAKGNIDAPAEDHAIKAEALKVPQLRYDLWASDAGKPSFWSLPCAPPAPLADEDRALGAERGRALEWDTWDPAAPLRDCLIRFSAEEVQRLWELARGEHTERENQPSRLDAVLAHIWRLVTRARGLRDGDINLDVSLGLRPRLGPSITPSFLGSPVINASATLPVATLANLPQKEALQLAASASRQVVTATTRYLPALLHHYAFALDPTREWNAFMGERHLMVTSWLGSTFAAADFGAGKPWMWPDMPWVDGLVNLIDATPSGPHPRSSEHREAVTLGRPEASKRRWHEDGIGVRVVLKPDVLDRLLADPELRP